MNLELGRRVCGDDDGVFRVGVLVDTERGTWDSLPDDVRVDRQDPDRGGPLPVREFEQVLDLAAHDAWRRRGSAERQLVDDDVIEETVGCRQALLAFPPGVQAA